MTPEMERNQLQYFRKLRGTGWLTKRAAAILHHFQALTMLGESDCVADIGCGPFGGVLPWIPGRRVGIDPLWEEYGDICEFGLYTPIIGTAMQWNTPMKFDVVVSVDALQYEPDIGGFLRECKYHMNPGASLFVHLPARSKAQRNPAHPYTHDLDAIRISVESSPGWDVQRSTVFERDPLSNKPYRTLILEAALLP